MAKDNNRIDAKLDAIIGNLDSLTKAVSEIKDTQDNKVLPSVTTTEITLKSYADSYKTNKFNIDRLDNRVTTIEDNLGIDPPEDQKVPHFSAE